MSAPDNNAICAALQEPPQVSSEESSPLSTAKLTYDTSEIKEYTLYKPSQTEQCEQSNSTAIVKKGKLVVPSTLIHDDPAKQSKNGLDAMVTVIETIDRLGYDNCLGHKKRHHF